MLIPTQTTSQELLRINLVLHLQVIMINKERLFSNKQSQCKEELQILKIYLKSIMQLFEEEEINHQIDEVKFQYS